MDILSFNMPRWMASIHVEWPTSPVSIRTIYYPTKWMQTSSIGIDGSYRDLWSNEYRCCRAFMLFFNKTCFSLKSPVHWYNEVLNRVYHQLDLRHEDVFYRKFETNVNKCVLLAVSRSSDGSTPIVFCCSYMRFRSANAERIALCCGKRLPCNSRLSIRERGLQGFPSVLF